jgi:hypothetical protein
MSLEDINPNRGLIQRPLPNGGPLISMAKDTPGVYFDANGVQVDDDLAASAGFDVEGDRILQRKAAAKAAANKKIEEQFAAEKARIDGMSDDELVAESDAADAGDDPVRDDGAPFIEKNASGEPRRARTVQDGPVKEMVYSNTAPQGWKVINADTGETIDEELNQEAAMELLLAE